MLADRCSGAGHVEEGGGGNVEKAVWRQFWRADCDMRGEKAISNMSFVEGRSTLFSIFCVTHVEDRGKLSRLSMSTVLANSQ